MATFHVTLEASVPDPLLATLDEESELRARSALLTHGWYERRTINWRLQSRPIDHNGQSQTRHQVRLDLDCPRIARPKCASFCFHLDVVTSGEDDPCDKARRILDLPGVPPALRPISHPSRIPRSRLIRQDPQQFGNRARPGRLARRPIAHPLCPSSRQLRAGRSWAQRLAAQRRFRAGASTQIFGQLHLAHLRRPNAGGRPFPASMQQRRVSFSRPSMGCSAGASL